MHIPPNRTHWAFNIHTHTYWCIQSSLWAEILAQSDKGACGSNWLWPNPAPPPPLFQPSCLVGAQNVLLHDIYLSAVFISCRVGTGGGRPNVCVCVCSLAPSRCFKASMMSPLIRAFKHTPVHVSSGVGCRRGRAIAHAAEFRTLAKQFCLLPGTLFFAVLLFFKLSANWREGLNVRSRVAS